MIRDLLSAEAHRDPYVWAAVLLAHFAVGVMLWPVAGIWAVSGYAAFEAMQAAASRRIWWDSVLDWCAVVLGSCAAFFMVSGALWYASCASVSALSIAAVGYKARQ